MEGDCDCEAVEREAVEPDAKVGREGSGWLALDLAGADGGGGGGDVKNMISGDSSRIVTRWDGRGGA